MGNGGEGGGRLARKRKYLVTTCEVTAWAKADPEKKIFKDYDNWKDELEIFSMILARKKVSTIIPGRWSLVRCLSGLEKIVFKIIKAEVALRVFRECKTYWKVRTCDLKHLVYIWC